MSSPQTQRTVPEVLTDIVGNLEMIVRAEFRLAKTELKEDADKALRPAEGLGISLALGFYALGCLVLSGIYGLTLLIAPWLAALTVGVALGLVAVVVAIPNWKTLRELGITPTKTVKNMEDNLQWAKEQIK
jgi:uncharacterized membrane protein YqjE